MHLGLRLFYDRVRCNLSSRQCIAIVQNSSSAPSLNSQYGEQTVVQGQGRHATGKVNCIASLAIAAVPFFSLGRALIEEVPGNDCTKSRAISPRMAKLMFCGRSPVICQIFSASSFATTTPITLPPSSSKGPPLLPACPGAVICTRVLSPPTPARELTIPFVTFTSVSIPCNGNVMENPQR